MKHPPKYLSYPALVRCYPDMLELGFSLDYLQDLVRNGEVDAIPDWYTDQTIYEVAAVEDLLFLARHDPFATLFKPNDMFQQNQKLSPEQVLRLEGLSDVDNARERERLYACLQTRIHPRNPRRGITYKEYRRYRGLTRLEMDHLLRIELPERPLWCVCHHCRTVTLFTDLIPDAFLEEMQQRHGRHDHVYFTAPQDRFALRDYRFLPADEMAGFVADPVRIKEVVRDRTLGLRLLRLLQWLDVETLEEAAGAFCREMVAARFPEHAGLADEFVGLLGEYGLVATAEGKALAANSY